MPRWRRPRASSASIWSRTGPTSLTSARFERRVSHISRPWTGCAKATCWLTCPPFSARSTSCSARWTDELHPLPYLPLQGGGRRKAPGGGQQLRCPIDPIDPLPNPPPFRGRENSRRGGPMSVRRLAAPEIQPKDFAFNKVNLEWAQKEITKYPAGRQQSAIIPLLWRAQEQSDGWLPEAAIRHVADFLGMAHIRALEVATFYTMFNLEPVGKFHVQLCGTTPCRLRGADDLEKLCKKKIGEQGDVTDDGKFSWVEVECLGACVNAPMVQINADYYEDLTPDSLTRIINDLSAGRAVKPGPQNDRINSAPLGGPITLTDPSLYPSKGRASGGGDSPDGEAKKPGDAANVHEAPIPKPPIADSTDPRRQ